MADFFEEHEQRALVRFGDRAFQELLTRLHRAQTGGDKQKSKDHHRGALEYEDKYITLLDQHKIYATLEEIADLYISDEKKMVLDFSDSRELAVLQRASSSAPLEYTGLRWSLFKSPNRHLAKGQDFCYLEVMKPYFAANGRRGWAKLSHSIETTICPDFSKTLNVNRGQLYFCGVFFQETSKPGVLDGFFYYNVDRTRIPSILAPAIMKARGKNNAELINHYAKMSRLLVGVTKEQVASVAQQLKSETRCGACANRMPKWKSKERCHFCSAYMCKKCCKIVSKNYRVENLGKKQACFACADEHGTKLTRMDDEDSASSRSRTSSASSREVETPRAATGSQGSAAAAATAAASPAHFVAHKNNRSTSEPVHRQQQLLNMQRHAEMLRQRSQTQGVPERIRLDGGGGSPTGSHKSERVASSRPEGVRRRQRDPFAAGRPMKAASEQGYSTYARDPERTVTLEKEKPSQLTPEAAVGLDLSYLSSYK
ncbi:hypothetical protein Gpo141_00011260 [Globisporangium polare]